MGLYRAKWTVWWELKRRKVDGTLDGRTLYRVDGLRLVRSIDGGGFNPVVECAGCRRLRVSRRQLTRADLSGAPLYDRCGECVARTMRPMDLGGLDTVLARAADSEDRLAGD